MVLILILCWVQAGCGHSLSGVQRWSVWFMSLISAGIAVASVVVNDYFDLKLDTTNAPDKPLPSGEGLGSGSRQTGFVC
jgi:4-hydroxybenzoate polyprenyltransferase